ncbi:MAG: NUDIX hydrolase [bacterium]|nr:MAG: NUDIX hydrolase [bacterium]
MYGFLLKIWKVLKFPVNLKVWIMGLINDQFLIGVTGIFFNDDNRVLLVKHSYRGGDNWSLPGGYIKKGEHPKEGLEREVDEETGYIVSADTRLKIRTDRNNARLDITYAGQFIGGNYKASKEIKTAKFFKFEELPMLPQDQLVFINEAYKLRL